MSSSATRCAAALVLAASSLGAATAVGFEETPRSPTPSAIRERLAALRPPDLDGVDEAVGDQLLAADRRARAIARGAAGEIDFEALGSALTEVGALHLAYGDHARAQASLSLGADVGPERVRTLYLLGFSLHESGRPEAALEPLERAAALRRDDAALALRLGRVLLEIGRGRDAASAFERARGADPLCAAADYGLGVLAADGGRLEEAASHFRAALGKRPSLAEARYALGMTLRDLGRRDEARAEIEGAAGGDRASSSTWGGCADALLAEVRELATGHAVHLMRATLARQRGDVRGELAELEQAVEASPEEAGLRASFGARFMELERFGEAAKQFEWAARLDPASPAHRYDLGEAARAAGRVEDARRAYGAAVEIDGTFLPALERLAGIALVRQELPEAVRLYRRALEVDPAADRLRVPLAMALYRLGDPSGGARELSRALDGDLGLAAAERLQLVETLLVLGGVEDALRHFAPYLETATAPELSARANFWVGSVALGRGELDQARSHLERALALDPSLEQARSMLGQLDE